MDATRPSTARTDDDAERAPALAGLAGVVLAVGMTAIGAVRGPRPIHTTGLLLTGRIRWRRPTATRSGIAWIDERPEGDTPVTARLSRGAALPAMLPDVIGLAVRVDGREGDLLLSSTGIGVPGRFLLRPRRTPAGAVLSTLMPYRGAEGPVLVAARSIAPTAMPASMEDIRAQLLRSPWRLELMSASPTGLWRRFADLELVPADGPIDAAEPRFDPVLRPPAGAGTYAWTRALREPAYAAGRRAGRSRSS